jgi:hypothetical protein
MKMIELRLQELRDHLQRPGWSEAADAVDAVLDEIIEADGSVLSIEDAQLLPNGTILASLTECFIKSYPDVTHPWRTSSGRVLSDTAMNRHIEARTVALYRYGTGLDHTGNPM